MRDKECVCPYHISDTDQLIVCEGIVPNSNLELGFASSRIKRNHKTMFCEKVFFRCPYAAMLNTQLKRYNVVSCKWNKGVDCIDQSQCDQCGWNPAVAGKRLQQFINFD